MSRIRAWKSLVYPLLPSVSRSTHGKRRKGLFYRWCPPEGLECQREQDRCFWSFFLNPEKGGKFLEVGGDGIIGSQTLGLELLHGWAGAVHPSERKARARTKEVRSCRVLEPAESYFNEKSIDLLAIHSPAANKPVFTMMQEGEVRPKWVIVENREPDPQWCRLLEGLGYRMKFFFHDDEYYEFKA